MTLLVILFGREREVRLGNQIHANKECDKTTYDLKLERRGGWKWVTPCPPGRRLEFLVL